MPIYSIKRTSTLLQDPEIISPYPGAYFKEDKWYLDIPDTEDFLREISETEGTGELILCYNKFTKTISVEIYDDYRE